jgi:IS30 family transposase
MAPIRKTHEARMLKMEEKMHILAWKDKGVSSEEIAKRLGRHRSSIDRLVAKARLLPSLITPPRKKALEDREKWTRPLRQSSKGRCSNTP